MLMARYYFEAWLEHKKGDKHREIFLDLPEQLQGVVALHQTRKFLHRTRILQDIDENALEFLAARLNPITVTVGQSVCNQGEEADRLWILESGVFHFLVYLIAITFSFIFGVGWYCRRYRCVVIRRKNCRG